MNADDLQRLADRSAEQREEMARQIREALHFTLSTPAGQRLWVWLVYEVCGLERDVPEERRKVALAMQEALVPYPELAAQVETMRSTIRQTEILFQAGQWRVRRESQKSQPKEKE